MALPTGTITMVFTDIQDSSDLSELYRAAFEPLRSIHFKLLRDTMTRWNGQEVSTAGDALFLVFEHALDAVQWAIDAQRALARHDWPVLTSVHGEAARAEIRIRIGMHTGEPFLVMDAGRADYFGPAVNRAARVSSAAHGGQTLISRATYVLVEDGLPPEITARTCGIHRLKGVGEEELWQIQTPDLLQEFPPLKTLDARRHNLPVPATPYLGRDEELRAWLDRLRKPSIRVLTLTGFGGMGKTRSALQLAELSLDDYKDGVIWVEAEEARTGDELIQRIAAALRLPPPPFREQVIRFLQDRELLLILDNIEQVADAGRVVTGLLSQAPHIKLLVTSRRPLEIQAERVIELSPLKPSEAVQLFAGRVRDRQPSFELTPENAADVAELCARLDGVPLALELAASRITMLAPRQMLQRLNERFKLLQTRAPDLPERQRALRAAIDWSYDLLTDDDKSLFAQLSVFAGGFALEDAEAVCDSFDILEGVAELRRQSLLRSEIDAETQQTRFLMLNSLREYAQERLSATPDAAATRLRHANYFLDYARGRIEQMRTPGEAEAQRELTIYADNLRAAMDYAEADGTNALFAELGLVRGQTLGRRGYSMDALQSVEAALRALKPHRDAHAALYAKLVEENAGLLSDRQDWERARSLAEEALELYTGLHDESGRTRLESQLGTIAYGVQDFASARVHLERALAGAESGSNATLLGMVFNNLGLTMESNPAGDPERADAYYHQALELRRRQGDARGQAETLNNLGMAAYRRGDWPQAQRFYSEALDQEQALGNVLGSARLLFNLAEVAQEQADSTRALRLAAASEYLMDLIKSPLIEHPSQLIADLAATPEAAEQAAALRQAVTGQPVEALIPWAYGEAAPSAP